jgi:hypothetical protein
MATKNLDDLPKKAPDTNFSQEAVGPKGTSHIFVDYDLIHVDPHNSDKIYGNWRNDATQACREKKVDRWVSRKTMRNYDFVEKCPGSRDGIWKFAIET